MEAKFYNFKSKLYLGPFSVKTLFMPSSALDAISGPILGYSTELKVQTVIWLRQKVEVDSTPGVPCGFVDFLKLL